MINTVLLTCMKCKKACLSLGWDEISTEENDPSGSTRGMWKCPCGTKNYRLTTVAHSKPTKNSTLQTIHIHNWYEE